MVIKCKRQINVDENPEMGYNGVCFVQTDKYEKNTLRYLQQAKITSQTNIKWSKKERKTQDVGRVDQITKTLSGEVTWVEAGGVTHLGGAAGCVPVSLLG